MRNCFWRYGPCESFFLWKILKKISKNVGFLDHLHRPMDGCHYACCRHFPLKCVILMPVAQKQWRPSYLITWNLSKNNNAQCTNNLWMLQIFQHEYHNHNTFLLYQPHMIRRLKPQWRTTDNTNVIRWQTYTSDQLSTGFQVSTQADLSLMSTLRNSEFHHSKMSFELEIFLPIVWILLAH